jgi:8-oxo-dGTP diphosphatase
MDKTRRTVKIAAYIYLEQESKFLFMRRFNTGYFDGYYGLPSGHIEVDESPDEAAFRELFEETGVKANNLEFENVIFTSDGYICFFFSCNSWNGIIENRESTKCDDLSWHSLKDLPEKMPPEVVQSIKLLQTGDHYISI